MDGERREDECLEGGDQPDLERKKTNASGSVSTAERGQAEQDGQPAAHEQDQQVAGEDVRESRTDSEMIRTNCEITSITKIGPRRPGVPAGIQPGSSRRSPSP